MNSDVRVAVHVVGILNSLFTKLFLENALAIRPYNCEAASEPLLPKFARCIPVLPSRYGEVSFFYREGGS